MTHSAGMEDESESFFGPSPWVCCPLISITPSIIIVHCTVSSETGFWEIMDSPFQAVRAIASRTSIDVVGSCPGIVTDQVSAQELIERPVVASSNRRDSTSSGKIRNVELDVCQLLEVSGPPIVAQGNHQAHQSSRREDLPTDFILFHHKEKVARKAGLMEKDICCCSSDVVPYQA